MNPALRRLAVLLAIAAGAIALQASAAVAAPISGGFERPPAATAAPVNSGLERPPMLTAAPVNSGYERPPMI